MTQALLKQIAKAKKIDLSHFDSVHAFINSNYTFVYVIIGLAEVVGGRKRLHNEQLIKLSISSIIKKGELIPEDYLTNGVQYFDYLKKE